MKKSENKNENRYNIENQMTKQQRKEEQSYDISNGE